MRAPYRIPSATRFLRRVGIFGACFLLCRSADRVAVSILWDIPGVGRRLNHTRNDADWIKPRQSFPSWWTLRRCSMPQLNESDVTSARMRKETSPSRWMLTVPRLFCPNTGAFAISRKTYAKLVQLTGPIT